MLGPSWLKPELRHTERKLAVKLSSSSFYSSSSSSSSACLFFRDFLIQMFNCFVVFACLCISAPHFPVFLYFYIIFVFFYSKILLILCYA